MNVNREVKLLRCSLHRIEKEVQTIDELLSKNVYRTEILDSVREIQSQLNSFSGMLLGIYLRTCIESDARDLDEKNIAPLVEAMQKVMK